MCGQISRPDSASETVHFSDFFGSFVRSRIRRSVGGSVNASCCQILNLLGPPAMEQGAGGVCLVDGPK